MTGFFDLDSDISDFVLMAKPKRPSSVSKTNVLAKAKAQSAPKRKAAPPPPRSKNNKNQLSISQCAAEYARLLANPYTSEHGACLPTYPPHRSQKVTVVVRGTYGIGTQGVGYVLFNPHAGARSDADCGVKTTTSYTGTVLDTDKAELGVDAVVPSSAPYTSAEVGNSDTQVQFRTVAVAARHRYIGRDDETAGQMVSFKQPDQQDIDGLYFENLLSYSDTVVVPTHKKWNAIIWTPTDTDDIDFSGVQGTNVSMALVTAGATSGSNVAFELYFHLEYVGTAPSGSYTASAADPEGLSWVQSAFQAPVVQNAIALGRNYGPMLLKGIAVAAAPEATTGIMHLGL
jgi:hypothetical protein